MNQSAIQCMNHNTNCFSDIESATSRQNPPTAWAFKPSTQFKLTAIALTNTAIAGALLYSMSEMYQPADNQRHLLEDKVPCEPGYYRTDRQKNLAFAKYCGAATGALFGLAALGGLLGKCSGKNSCFKNTMYISGCVAAGLGLFGLIGTVILATGLANKDGECVKQANPSVDG